MAPKKSQKVAATSKAANSKKVSHVSFQNNKNNKNYAAPNEFVKNRLEGIHTIINRLEKELESLFKRFLKTSGESRFELKHQFDEIINRLIKSSFYSKAQEKREDLENELRRLSDLVLDKVKSVEFAQNFFSAKKFLNEARKGINGFKKRVEKSGFLSNAMMKASNAKSELFSFLSIPSNAEVERLEKKVSVLEKRLHTLSGKAA